MATLNEWQDILDRFESDINREGVIELEYPDESTIRVCKPSELPISPGTVIAHEIYSVYLLRENGMWVSACTCGSFSGLYTAEELFKHLLTLDPRQPFKVIHS